MLPLGHEAVRHLHARAPSADCCNDLFVGAFHVAGAAVAVQQRDAVLVEGGLALGVAALRAARDAPSYKDNEQAKAGAYNYA